MNEVKISKKRLAQLEKAESKLQALESGGVDNWEWYGEALKYWNKENQLEEIIQDFIENAAQILAECNEVDYPAGREAGPSVNLTLEGEEGLRSMFNIFFKEYRELEENH